MLRLTELTSPRSLDAGPHLQSTLSDGDVSVCVVVFHQAEYKFYVHDFDYFETPTRIKINPVEVPSDRDENHNLDILTRHHHQRSSTIRQ